MQRNHLFGIDTLSNFHLSKRMFWFSI